MYKIPYTRKTTTDQPMFYLDLVSISQLYRTKVRSVEVSDKLFRKALKNAFYEIFKFAAVHRRSIRLPKGLGTIKLEETYIPDATVDAYSGLARIPFNYSEMYRLKKENKPGIVFDLFSRFHYKRYQFKHSLSSSIPYKQRYKMYLPYSTTKIRKKLYADQRETIDNLKGISPRNPNFSTKELKNNDN